MNHSESFDKSIIGHRSFDASEDSSSSSFASTVSMSTFDDTTTGITTTTTCITTTSDNITQQENNSQNIKVVARIRPLSSKEQRENSNEILSSNKVTNSIRVDNNRNFVFDKVFHSLSTQSEVYEQTAGEMIQNHLFKGFNVTILAYGQTGSGKTHTIFGANGNKFSSQLNEEEDGIIPRAVHELFDKIRNHPSGQDKIQVEMSFLEIYNEEAKDLLATDTNHVELSIRETANGVYVKNLSRHSVVSPEEVAALMLSAAEKRSVASTLMNEVSSRSHAICTLYMNLSPLEADSYGEENVSAKLTLVDLAGSERVKKTGAEGMRLKEGININKGLFVLGQVVSSLSELGKQGGSSDSSSIHVNYRDSKLTRLLQDSLGGNSKTVMIACVSPADYNLEESINTLRYAERTRSIKNAAVRNVIATSLSPAEAAALRKENQMLKLRLLQAQNKINTHSNPGPGTNEILKVLSEKLGKFEGVPNFLCEGINGLNVDELDVMTRLMLNCTAMEQKMNKLEEKSKAAVSDTLQASLNADRWQMKYQSLLTQVKNNDITALDDECNDSETDSLQLVEQMRKEIIVLKEQLSEAGIDAEVSRATAAAVLNGRGDLAVAETMAIVHSDHEDDPLFDNSVRLSAELVAMSGSIEQKEIMFQQANSQRESLDALRSHFEGALKALQEEVDVLSLEKESLVSQMNNEKGLTKDTKVDCLKQRISVLENRIKELRQKAADHSNALRLRDQAEQKVKKLQAEICEDKRKRAELQRKLKEESMERRNERKEAQMNAAKYLRDSNRIKHELAKVKESAARQEIVLKRKAEQAIMKQQRLEEQSKKRGRKICSHLYLSQERKDEINCWIDKEVKTHTNSYTTSFHDISFFEKLSAPELQYVSKAFFQRTLTKSHRKQSLPKKKREVGVIEQVDVFEYIEDDEQGVEDSDDSDWSPDTPAPVKKRAKIKKDIDIQKQESDNSELNQSRDGEDHEALMKLTVSQLRLKLRQSGLTVSGKKSELVKRLMYSARAKEALISPIASNSAVVQSAKKKTPISNKMILKRPVSRSTEVIPSSSKKQKLTQETISSSLRKGFPIASSSRPLTTSSLSVSVSRKKSPSARSTIRRKKSPIAISTFKTPNRIGTETRGKNSKQDSKLNTSGESLQSVKSLPPSNRVSSRRTNTCLSPTQPTAVNKNSSNQVKAAKDTILGSKNNTSAPNIRFACDKRMSIINTSNNTNGKVAQTKPLSTITNSAKKRKNNRRASMTKSVNKALLQLEQLEQLL